MTVWPVRPRFMGRASITAVMHFIRMSPIYHVENFKIMNADTPLPSYLPLLAGKNHEEWVIITRSAGKYDGELRVP